MHADVTTPLAGPLTIKSLNALTGTFQVAGDVTTTDTSVGGNADSSPVLVFMGNKSQHLIATPPANTIYQIPGVEINKSGGSLTLPSTISVIGSWIVDSGNQGVVNAPASSLVVFGPYSSPTIDTGSAPSPCRSETSSSPAAALAS